MAVLPWLCQPWLHLPSWAGCLLLTSDRLTIQTKPVVDYYSKLGLYSPIDANQKSDTVKAAIAAILK